MPPSLVSARAQCLIVYSQAQRMLIHTQNGYIRKMIHEVRPHILFRSWAMMHASKVLMRRYIGFFILQSRQDACDGARNADAVFSHFRQCARQAGHTVSMMSLPAKLSQKGSRRQRRFAISCRHAHDFRARAKAKSRVDDFYYFNAATRAVGRCDDDDAYRRASFVANFTRGYAPLRQKSRDDATTRSRHVLRSLLGNTFTHALLRAKDVVSQIFAASF